MRQASPGVGDLGSWQKGALGTGGHGGGVGAGRCLLGSQSMNRCRARRDSSSGAQGPEGQSDFQVHSRWPLHLADVKIICGVSKNDDDDNNSNNSNNSIL